MDHKFSVNLKTEAAVRQFHHAIHETDQDRNAGTQTLEGAAEAAGSATFAVGKQRKGNHYTKKVRNEGSYSRNVSEKGKTAEKEAKNCEGSNPRSRELQKKQHRESLYKQKGHVGKAEAEIEKKAAAEKEGEALEGLFGTTRKHAPTVVAVIAVAMAIIFTCTHLSYFISSMNIGNALIAGTTYSAEDGDINGADTDYTALETELKDKIDRTENLFPGYDEYRYDIADINHNPYVLTSYLTVMYGDFERADVQDALHTLFESNYSLTNTPQKEVRTRTVTKTRQVTDPVTGEISDEEYEEEEQYDYWILNVKLTNNTLEAAIAAQNLNEDQLQRFVLLNQTLGNRPDLFGSDIYSHPTASTDILTYDIPTEALSDEKFRKMITEAEKYLGFPYVWGGSSPSTSFDCSGFVCWVINHSGNGWNIGRTTAEGIRQKTKIIRASEARAGDIIFFQGTYDTPGASHVGIYVGNGMMIHCGSPIQYTSINSSYWQQHFYCFGRLQ